MKNIESEMLQEGVDFQITRNHPKFWQKKTKNFIIYPLCLGSMLKISKIINSIKDVAETLESENLAEKAIFQIEENIERIAEIIALAIMNKKISQNPIKKFYQNIKIRFLKNFLMDNLTSIEMQKIIVLIIEQLEVQHFLAVLVSLKGISLTSKETAKTEKETK